MGAFGIIMVNPRLAQRAHNQGPHGRGEAGGRRERFLFEKEK